MHIELCTKYDIHGDSLRKYLPTSVFELFYCLFVFLLGSRGCMTAPNKVPDHDRNQTTIMSRGCMTAPNKVPDHDRNQTTIMSLD